MDAAYSQGRVPESWTRITSYRLSRQPPFWAPARGGRPRSNQWQLIPDGGSGPPRIEVSSDRVSRYAATGTSRSRPVRRSSRRQSSASTELDSGYFGQLLPGGGSVVQLPITQTVRAAIETAVVIGKYTGKAGSHVLAAVVALGHDSSHPFRVCHWVAYNIMG